MTCLHLGQRGVDMKYQIANFQDEDLSGVAYMLVSTRNGVSVVETLEPLPHNVLVTLDSRASLFDHDTTIIFQQTPVEEVASDMRARRSQLLQESDWTQLPDVPLATKEVWAAYRQALRDITAQPGFPLTVAWPTPPTN